MHLQPTLDENLSIVKHHFAGAAVPINGKHVRPISILYLITGLEIGGAEMMLYRLLSGMDRQRFVPQVVSLVDLDRGPLSEKVQSLGVPLRSLGMRPGRPNPLSVLRLARWLQEDQPDVISTWMYHADLLGSLAARLAGNIPVAWGIHQSDLSSEGNRWHTLQTIKACARLSAWLPARIVCCSESTWKSHAAIGYATDKMIVIPNGSDLATFKPDSAARASVRKELGISDEAPLIGLVGRFHRQKDHHNFVQAAALLHRRRGDVHFLLCGEDITWENPSLTRWIQEVGIKDQCRLLGIRADIPRLAAALDIAVSSSFGEAFSNVLGEAMSCGVPCVVTDVGDSALIVGPTGRVVPPRNPDALARALGELVELGPEGRSHLGIAARERIAQHFDLRDIIYRYQNLYLELADAVRGGAWLKWFYPGSWGSTCLVITCGL